MSAAGAFDDQAPDEPTEPRDGVARRTARTGGVGAGIIALWLALAAAVYVEVALAIDARILGAVPGLALIAIVAIAIRLGAVAGSVAGFAAGLLIDLAVQGPLGATALVLTPVGWAAGWWAERRRRVSLAMATSVLALSTLAAIAADALVATAVEGQGVAWGALGVRGAAELALTVIVGIPGLALLRRVGGVPVRSRA